eukprot:1392105-Amorphochlora_amoeboformis.AAC.2
MGTFWYSGCFFDQGQSGILISSKIKCQPYLNFQGTIILADTLHGPYGYAVECTGEDSLKIPGIWTDSPMNPRSASNPGEYRKC